MRRININNPEELKKFKLETSGFVSSYGFPYRLDDLTEKGANYTVFCPLRWKSAFSPAKLHKLLLEDVDAEVIKVEYIDFVKEEIEDKTEKVRRALMKFIEKFPYERLENDGVSVKDALAWLEKQGESYTKRDVDDAYVEGMAFAKNELEKQGKQEPAWSEEDEHRVKDTIYFLDTAKKHYASTVELDACINWLKSLKQRIGGE